MMQKNEFLSYLEGISEETREALEKIIRTAEESLPQGFERRYGGGMLSYVVPLTVYEKGYHAKKGEPLPFISIAAQKGHIALYHMGLYGDQEASRWFEEEYRRQVPTKLDMGKSCIRLKNPKQIPYALLAELFSRWTPQEYIASYEKILAESGKNNAKRVKQEKNMTEKENMKKVYTYEGIIEKVPDKDGAYVAFPYDVRKEFQKGRVKVHATFDGEPYDGSIVNMGVKNEDGSICYIIGIQKAIRKKIGKEPGDKIRVTITAQE